MQFGGSFYILLGIVQLALNNSRAVLGISSKVPLNSI